MCTCLVCVLVCVFVSVCVFVFVLCVVVHVCLWVGGSEAGNASVETGMRMLCTPFFFCLFVCLFVWFWVWVWFVFLHCLICSCCLMYWQVLENSGSV